jgi:hypothetical protein
MEGIQYGIQQGYNPMTAAYASQPYATQFGPPREYGQQGLFGSPVNPLSGLMGSGIPGLLGGQSFGRQPGQGMEGFGGMFQPYGNPYGNIDPMTAAHLQQTQLGQQGQYGQQTHPAQQAQLALQAQLAQLVQQQVAQHLAQQRAQFGQPFGQQPQFGQQQQFGQQPLFGQQGQSAPWLGVNPISRIDPMTAAYIQQAQIAQLCQQLALQGQLGQQGQFGQGQMSQGQMGQGQVGQGWFGGGQNPWANPQLAAQYGRALPWQYGGQLPTY